MNNANRPNHPAQRSPQTESIRRMASSGAVYLCGSDGTVMSLEDPTAESSLPWGDDLTEEEEEQLD